MKKLLKIFLIITVIFITNLSPSINEVNASETNPLLLTYITNDNSAKTLIAENNKQWDADGLIGPKTIFEEKNFGEFNLERLDEEDDPDSYVKAIVNFHRLPKLTTDSLIAKVVQIILGAVIWLTMIAIIVIGIYYLISRGKEEELTKAKNILIYLLIGVAIMAAAYSIIYGILQTRFF